MSKFKDRMKKFYGSNMFWMLVSVIASILLWVYVVYNVNPSYEMWVKDVPISCVNISEKFNEGSLVITGANEKLLTGGVTVDIKVKGKRSVVSSLDSSDLTCSLDLITVNNAGNYSLKPGIESGYSGIEITRISPANIKLNVESIGQKDVPVKIRTAGELPKDYVMEGLTSKNETVKITGAASVINNISSAEVLLDYGMLDVSESEKSLPIIFYTAKGEAADPALFSKTVEYAKLSFKICTTREVTIVLMPKYSNENKLNSRGDTVELRIDDANAASDGGLEMKVKLKGTSAAIEKYTQAKRTVYTTPVDVSDIYGEHVIYNVQAAPLSGDIEYVNLPEVDIRATIGTAQ